MFPAVSKRKLMYIQLAIVSVLIAVGVFLSVYLALAPCVLCKLQRLILFGLLGIIIGKLCCAYMRWLYYSFVVLMTTLIVIGGVLAWHHMHLQLMPDSKAGTCLPSLEVMWQYLSWSKILQSIFKSDVGCNEVTWQWMKLSIPQWLLLHYTLLFILQIWECCVPLLPAKQAKK